jgi:guanylate cyclase
MFERAEQRSTELERNYDLLDCWKRRGDELLYSMIPRSVADRLRTEKNSLNTCQVGS